MGVLVSSDNVDSQACPLLIQAHRRHIRGEVYDDLVARKGVCQVLRELGEVGRCERRIAKGLGGHALGQDHAIGAKDAGHLELVLVTRRTRLQGPKGVKHPRGLHQRASGDHPHKYRAGGELEGGVQLSESHRCVLALDEHTNYPLAILRHSQDVHLGIMKGGEEAGGSPWSLGDPLAHTCQDRVAPG